MLSKLDEQIRQEEKEVEESIKRLDAIAYIIILFISFY